MKRDMDLVRKLLLYIEENCTHDGVHSPQVSIDGYASDDIGYNLHIMADGGLLDVVPARAMGDRFPYYLINGITWDGHEFLDSIRDEGVWSHTRKALKPIGSASFEVVKAVAVAYVSSRLGLQ